MIFSSRSPLGFALTIAVAAVTVGIHLSRTVATRPTALVANERQAAIPEPYARHRLSSGRRLTLDSDRFGQFHADVEIEGRVLRMMVDTGATAVSLSWDDSVSMGIRPAPYEFTVRMRTANGVVSAAMVRLHEVRVGGIVVRDVPAVVSPPGQSTPNLLGMTFLNNLHHFEISNRQLVLEE